MTNIELVLSGQAQMSSYYSIVQREFPPRDVHCLPVQVEVKLGATESDCSLVVYPQITYCSSGYGVAKV